MKGIKSACLCKNIIEDFPQFSTYFSSNELIEASQLMQLNLFDYDRFIGSFENASRIILISLILRFQYAAAYVKINYIGKYLYRQFSFKFFNNLYVS